MFKNMLRGVTFNSTHVRMIEYNIKPLGSKFFNMPHGSRIDCWILSDVYFWSCGLMVDLRWDGGWHI